MNGGTATVFGAVVGVNGCREYEFGNVGCGRGSSFTSYVLRRFSLQTFYSKARCNIFGERRCFDCALIISIQDNC